MVKGVQQGLVLVGTFFSMSHEVQVQFTTLPP